jgi:acetylornithine deacetylase/succinyl-diaminopimelate desuccinylase-like protein
MIRLRMAIAVGSIWLSIGLLAALASAQNAPRDDTSRLLAELIRLDTTNPPGREGRVGRFLARQFKALGFEVRLIPTPEAGKSHFIARLKGNGSRRPVLLAAHADVVGVERKKWSVDPFAGVIKDGYVYGRGAIDFKGGMAVFAQAVMDLARNKVPLARDVIFLAEADEEGGRYDTSWLAERHWPLIDCEFALNEGGWIIKNPEGQVRYVSISTADKVGISLVLTAKGTSTHSSMPRPGNAISTLAAALSRLAEYETQLTLIPSTREFFSALAQTSEPPLSTRFRDLVSSSDPEAVKRADREISKDPLLHAMLHNTIAPVMLNAGFRTNVIPGSAEATINCRMIPGTDPADLIREVTGVIADPRIQITVKALPGMTPEQTFRSLTKRSRDMKPSSQATDLYRALVKQARSTFPGALVTPYLFQAGTDARAWRSRGVPVYGIYPYPIDAADLSRMHGNDERVSVQSLRQGREMIYRTLVDVAARR